MFWISIRHDENLLIFDEISRVLFAADSYALYRFKTFLNATDWIMVSEWYGWLGGEVRDERK